MCCAAVIVLVSLWHGRSCNEMSYFCEHECSSVSIVDVLQAYAMYASVPYIMCRSVAGTESPMSNLSRGHWSWCHVRTDRVFRCRVALHKMLSLSTTLTVKHVFFAWTLFRDFRDLCKFAKITGANMLFFSVVFSNKKTWTLRTPK